ncbi:MAG: phytoene desaturase family protein [Acidobacteriota bacterium]
MQRACVIGSGPNGLAAAIVLAQAGLRVEVYEAEAEPGGAARTLPLTLPGFLHDFGSAVHPFAAGSPFFATLPLADYGLEWVHGEAALAHPLDDGSAVVLDRDLAATARALGADGAHWRRLVEPAASHWEQLAEDALAPALHVPHHPLLMARFGLGALESALALARSRFAGAAARAVFAGLAGHSLMSLDQPLTAAIGTLFAASLHGPGWPVPRGGARAIPHALIGYLESLGGKIVAAHRMEAGEFRQLLAEGALMMCDVAPRQLLALAGDQLSVGHRLGLAGFRPGPGAFKIDYALSEPVPWRAPGCRRAITVHLGGTLEEIAASEFAAAHGREPERPLVLAAQPSLFDPARAPHGNHVLWVYCHVPNGSSFDMTGRIEAQIERFAPGFRDCVLARHVSPPALLESRDANLIGGDIGGGAITLRQFFFRPTLRTYATTHPRIYLCSASTPPGGGVHGMCGYHAARMALRRLSGHADGPK